MVPNLNSIMVGKDIKPGRHWAFYGLVMVTGWVAPPVAILIRFGLGMDFFICLILTLCGYIPGHAYNFYCQNIRNNHGRGRTPKWAIKAGLVKVSDPKSKPKHQWQNRYDERTAHRADGYEDSVSSTNVPEWDGRGAMPSPRDDRSEGGSFGKKKKKGHRLAPWGSVVTPDEVEGGGADFVDDTPAASGYGPGPAGEREEFYAPAAQPSRYERGGTSTSGPAPRQRPSKLRSIVTGTKTADDPRSGESDFINSAPERHVPKDRHTKMEASRKGSRRAEDPDRDRRNGVGYYDGGEADPWSRSSEGPKPAGSSEGPKPARQGSDPLSHDF